MKDLRAETKLTLFGFVIWVRFLRVAFPFVDHVLPFLNEIRAESSGVGFVNSLMPGALLQCGNQRLEKKHTFAD